MSMQDDTGSGATCAEANGRRIRHRVPGGEGAALVMVQVEAADEVNRRSDAFLRR